MGNGKVTSSYTWQLMRLMQHFYLNVTINHYWVFVITSDCHPIWILVKRRGRNMLLLTFQNNWMWKIHRYNFCGAWRKSNVTNYCCQKVISKVTILLLKGVMSNILHWVTSPTLMLINSDSEDIYNFRGRKNNNLIFQINCCFENPGGSVYIYINL